MLFRHKIFLTAVVIGLSPAAANAASGNTIFHEKCAVCHGTNGIAVLPGAPSFAKGERMEKTDATLKHTITNGLNVMPSFKGVLSDGQMSEVLAYIRTLKK